MSVEINNSRRQATALKATAIGVGLAGLAVTAMGSAAGEVGIALIAGLATSADVILITMCRPLPDKGRLNFRK